MTNLEKLIHKVKTRLAKRDDIMMLEDAEVPVFGIVKRTYGIRRYVGSPQHFQPYEDIQQREVGHAFAVDFIKAGEKPTKRQQEARDYYTSFGCLYVLADDENQVWALLGA